MSVVRITLIWCQVGRQKKSSIYKSIVRQADGLIAVRNAYTVV